MQIDVVVAERVRGTGTTTATNGIGCTGAKRKKTRFLSEMFEFGD